MKRFYPPFTCRRRCSNIVASGAATCEIPGARAERPPCTTLSSSIRASSESLLADGVVVAISTDVTCRQGEIVSFVHHYQFSTGEDPRSASTLRFRDERQLTASLVEAGFTLERIDGGWREPTRPYGTTENGSMTSRLAD